jgi:hypothetical protein
MSLRTRYLPAYTWVSVFFFFAGVSTAWAQNYAFGQSNLAAGAQPTSMATGDFNGDGKLDLVVANLGANTVSVFLGKPDGTFGPKVDYPTGLQPFAVATGDFNGDGNLDIVVTTEDCTPIPIFPHSSAGQAQSAFCLGTATAPFSHKWNTPPARHQFP